MSVSSPSTRWTKILEALKEVLPYVLGYILIAICTLIATSFLFHIDSQGLNAYFAKDINECRDNYIKAYPLLKDVSEACNSVVLKTIIGKAALVLIASPLAIMAFSRTVFEILRKSVDESLNPGLIKRISRGEMRIAVSTLPMFILSLWCMWIYLAGANYVNQVGFILMLFGIFIGLIVFYLLQSILWGLTSK